MIISVIKGEKLSKPTSVCLSFILHTHNHNTWAHHYRTQRHHYL